MLITNKMSDFKDNIEEIYKEVAEEREHKYTFEELLTYREEDLMIILTFSDYEEDFVDVLIRRVRDMLLDEYLAEELSFSIGKQHIFSHDYWSVDFIFGEKYKLTEWYGA